MLLSVTLRLHVGYTTLDSTFSWYDHADTECHPKCLDSGYKYTKSVVRNKSKSWIISASTISWTLMSSMWMNEHLLFWTHMIQRLIRNTLGVTTFMRCWTYVRQVRLGIQYKLGLEDPFLKILWWRSLIYQFRLLKTIQISVSKIACTAGQYWLIQLGLCYRDEEGA